MDLPKPINKKDQYLYAIAKGTAGSLPEPVNRQDQYLYHIATNGVGGSVSDEQIASAVSSYIASGNSNFASKEDVNRLKSIDLNTPSSAAVVFITDDGSLSDAKLETISVEKGVPFVSAVYKYCPNRNNLKHLQDDLGWEIAGHHNNNLTLETQTYDSIKAKFQETIDFCKSLGLNIKNHVFANGGHNALIRKVASEFFNCAVNVGGGINICPVMQYNLNRVSMGSYFDNNDITKQGLTTSSLEYYKAVVDKAIAENGLLIFMLHPSHADHTDTQNGYISDTIDYIKSKNVDILTLQQAIERFGNKAIIGDYFGKDADNYYVEGADGQIINKLEGVNKISLQALTLNSVKATDLISVYPKGLSICEINAAAQGFPSTQGTLITYRHNAADILSWQMFKPNAVARINTRAVNTSGEWTEFLSSVEKQTTKQIEIDFGTITANATVEKTVDFTGATLNDNVVANAYSLLNTGLLSECYIKGGGTVSIRLYNITGADIAIGKKKFNITVFKK